jgi:hypothetical protein
LQPVEAFDESLGIGPDAGELPDAAEHVERRRHRRRILALASALAFALRSPPTM